MCLQNEWSPYGPRSLLFDSTYIHVGPSDVCQSCNRLLTAPPGRQGRPDSDWWASLTFVSDMQRRPEVPFIWRVTGGPGESRCGGRSLVLLMYILWSGHQLHDMSDSRARSLRLGQDVNAAPQELREEIGNSINDYWI